MDESEPDLVEIQNRDVLDRSRGHTVALDCLQAGIEAAHPQRVVERTISVEDDVFRARGTESGGFEHDLEAFDKVVLIGGGKAAATVAVELEELLGDRLADGIVVTTDATETDRITVVEGGHPIPNAEGMAGARAVRQTARDAGSDTLVIAVITGGASALLPLPADGIELQDLREVTQELLEVGATINEINAVRKHLSAVKGGRLAEAASPASTAILALSDVVGDYMGVIGSGPFSPDPISYTDARAVLDEYEITVSDAIDSRLTDGEAGDVPETPNSGDEIFTGVTSAVVATNRTACAAAARAADEKGYQSMVLSSRIEGEASEAALSMLGIAQESAETGDPIAPPSVFVSGGETTVTVSGDGTGGPNQEFVVAAGAELEYPEITVAAVDTDGADGPTDIAGGIVDANTLSRATARTALNRNDVSALLEASDSAVHTGPTGTNVNDLRVAVVGPSNQSSQEPTDG